MVLTRDRLRDTEVSHLHLGVGGNQDVAGLDVAVHHTLTVRVAQGRRDLGAQLGRACGRECATTTEYFGEGLALHEFHHNEVGTPVLAPVKDGNDVGVR